MSKVELRLNGLIDALKNKIDELRKSKELEKVFLDDELEVNDNEQMFRQFKEICKYDSKLMILEEIVKSLEYVRTGEYKREDKEIHEWYFKCFDHLMRLKEQGHFKDVNIEKQIGEILLNCEVIK